MHHKRKEMIEIVCKTTNGRLHTGPTPDERFLLIQSKDNFNISIFDAVFLFTLQDMEKSVAVWQPESGLAKVVQAHGEYWDSMAIVRDEALYCHVEEAV